MSRKNDNYYYYFFKPHNTGLNINYNNQLYDYEIKYEYNWSFKIEAYINSKYFTIYRAYKNDIIDDNKRLKFTVYNLNNSLTSGGLTNNNSASGGLTNNNLASGGLINNSYLYINKEDNIIFIKSKTKCENLILKYLHNTLNKDIVN